MGRIQLNKYYVYFVLKTIKLGRITSLVYICNYKATNYKTTKLQSD